MIDYNLKKYSLYVILDAYVTKNAIEEFILQDITELKDKLLLKHSLNYTHQKINTYLFYLKTELEEIEEFLNDSNNIYWTSLNKDRKFFDLHLPKHKRKIKWFHRVDRYPFDHGTFFIIDDD